MLTANQQLRRSQQAVQISVSVASLAVQFQVAVLFFSALALRAEAIATESLEERLIGWKGESYDSNAARASNLNTATTTTTTSSSSASSNIPWVERVAWEPRAFLYHNLLTDEECDYLISKARPKMEKSMVVDNDSGGSVPSKVRTSSGAFLHREEDEVIWAIEHRIANFTFIPVDHGESLHILHYEVGQEYQAHFDYFHDEMNVKYGGQRVATVLMYLTDVEAGGETSFPAADPEGAKFKLGDGPDVSDCAKGKVAVRPRKGDALLFWNLKPDSTLDAKSLHAGCPVIRGNKWSATKWLRLHYIGQ